MIRTRFIVALIVTVFMVSSSLSQLLVPDFSMHDNCNSNGDLPALHFQTDDSNEPITGPRLEDLLPMHKDLTIFMDGIRAYEDTVCRGTL